MSITPLPSTSFTISQMEVFSLQAPSASIDATDNMNSAAVIRVISDDGYVGYGEAAGPGPAVAALLTDEGSWAWDTSVAEIIIDQPFQDVSEAWTELMRRRWWSSRSGIGHVALAGLDMAIWDLIGKRSQRPVWQLLTDRPGLNPQAYVTLYDGPAAFDKTVRRHLDLIDAARDAGFRAAKIEALPDCAPTNRDIIDLVQCVREHVGPDFTLLCDVGYRWSNFPEAVECVRQLDAFGLVLLEAPFLPDKVDAYRDLASAVTTPVGGAEILTSYAEFVDLKERGTVSVLQPAVSRLGITETHRLANGGHGDLILFGWVPTTLGCSASVHLAAANASVALVEYAPPALYPQAALRSEICSPEPEVKEGEFVCPVDAGLGLIVDEVALERYRVR